MSDNHRLPPLNALRAFEAVVRLGSMARAADALAVTPGAVSQQVRLLESGWGAALSPGGAAAPTYGHGAGGSGLGWGSL